MDFLNEYDDEKDDSSQLEPQKKISKISSLKRMDIAPSVHLSKGIERKYDSTLQKEVYHNPEYDNIWAPVQGPTHPLIDGGSVNSYSNTYTGYVENTSVNLYNFDEQYHTFYNKGYAIDPSGQHYVGDIQNMNARRPKKKKRNFGDPADVEGYQGPWAPDEDERRITEELENLSEARDHMAPEIAAKQLEKEKEEAEKEEEEKKKKEKEEEEEEEKEKETKVQPKEIVRTKSIFHGEQIRDYLGRSFVQPPSHLKNLEHECFLPKKLIHTWTGHTQGVSVIRFLPKYGHLLLSGSMDTKVKIWDVYNNRICMRTYMGHSKAIRDICFNNDGTRFLSCSYDRMINLWDTETGTVLGSYTNGKIPYCIKFNPNPSRQNVFLAGCSDKKIIQWDTNSGKITQEYDQHLGAVNTITFIDDARRFVTSSDDKSIRVWEWGIPVVIKYISEPNMHSMPSIALHPNGKWFLGQSLDNQILVYGTRDRFRINKKKVFKGHLVAGYACQLGVSPDGHWVYSGDAEGNVWFWDWKNCRNIKTLKCHNKVSIGVEWHPIEPSKVATCSWDGTIKYWD